MNSGRINSFSFYMFTLSLPISLLLPSPLFLSPSPFPSPLFLSPSPFPSPLLNWTNKEKVLIPSHMHNVCVLDSSSSNMNSLKWRKTIFFSFLSTLIPMLVCHYSMLCGKKGEKSESRNTIRVLDRKEGKK